MNAGSEVNSVSQKAANEMNSVSQDAANETNAVSQDQTKPRPRPSRLRRLRGVLILSLVTGASGWLVHYSHPRPTILVSATLWLIYNVIVSIGLRKQPDAKSAESMKSRAVHEQLLLLGLVFLFAPLPGLTGRFVPDTPMTPAIGLGVQLAGMLFYFWSRTYLGRLWSGRITIMQGHHLVETGPYRFLRHPLYTGFIGMFVGTAVVSGQYHALFGIALCLIAYARKIRMEEAALRAEFGEAFDVYRRNRWAFIPWVY
jgi:protein-S-isoprenylcysteine O-methyltransferase Ste14